jgi:CheY-like chemotaxis protein
MCNPNTYVSNFDQPSSGQNVDTQFGSLPMPTRLKAQSKMVPCIDDDQDMLGCEEAFLESFGYTVLIAASGDQGVRLASTHAVDIVIVDDFMPGMNGQRAAAEMRRLRPQTPTVMLSG